MPFSKHEFNFFIYWHILHSSGFHHICNIICRLDCRYSPQNIFNAKKFNPRKKSTSLLNVPICTQGMQRTWWPEAGTIIVSGPYWMFFSLVGSICCYSKLLKKSGSVSLLPGSLGYQGNEAHYGRVFGASWLLKEGTEAAEVMVSCKQFHWTTVLGANDSWYAVWQQRMVLSLLVVTLPLTGLVL